MNEEAKIKAGILFSPADPQLKAMKLRTHKLNLDYNRLYEDEEEAREAIIHQIVGHIGEGSFFQGPVTFHYGVHTTVGKRCFFNFNLTPMVAAERREMLNSEGQRVRLCYARPVTIGNDCWLGAGVIVCPGVTIGDGCVIGAGSVVTKDIPANSFACGVPCRVVRPITEADSMAHLPHILGDNKVM